MTGLSTSMQGLATRSKLAMGASVGGVGGVSSGPEYLVIFSLHQSNMTGGQSNALGATLLSPDDDAATDIFEWSPNGGGGYQVGGADPTPSFARMLNAAATAQLRYPQGTAGTAYPRTERAVGPAWSLAKAAKAANPDKKIVIIPGGVGGTDTAEYFPGSGVSTNWPANRYNVIKTAYDTFKAAYPNSIIHAFAASILENEIANNRAGVGASQSVVDAYLFPVLDTWYDGWRALVGAGASDAPFILSSPLPEWLGYGNTQGRKYLLAGAKWAAGKPGVGFLRRAAGYATGGDNVHMTNAGNRLHGPEMYAHRAVTQALQTAPAAVPAVALTGETLTITSVGTPYYEVWTRAPAGSGSYTKFDFVTREASKVGSAMKLTLPLQGSRDAVVIAKNGIGGDSQAAPTSGTTPHVTYAVPAVTPPTPVVSLDFDNASLDGSLNMISVPSSGSDTAAWTPTSAAGQGATAAIKRVLVGSKYGILLDDASKSLWRGSAYVFPAGDISAVFAMQYNTTTNTGAFIGSGQSGATVDMYFTMANSGDNLRGGFNSTGVQVITTTSPLASQLTTTCYRLIAFLYSRTSNVLDIYIDDELVRSGTPTQRSASPANSGGTRFFNNGLDTATSGHSGSTIMLPPKVYNARLTDNELQKIKNDYRVAHGVTFGVSPP